MSTVDHILAGCGRLRVAWNWLGEATIPGRTRHRQRHLSDTARTQLDRQAAAERTDRHALLTSGRIPTGATTAPTNINALDAREKVASDIDHAAWVLASQLRDRVLPPYRAGQPAYRPDGRSTDRRFRTAIDWISLNAPRLQDSDRDTINTTYRALVDADTHARAVAGAGPDNRRLAAECPACGRRALVWNTDSTDHREWHVTCVTPRCRCSGRDCRCKLPDRQPGMVHLWLEAGWERFAEQMQHQEAL